MLHEVVGSNFEVSRVALYDGAQYSDEFLRLNPNHAVPVLEITWDNGTVQRVIESVAIVAFLADAYPAAGLARRSYPAAHSSTLPAVLRNAVSPPPGQDAEAPATTLPRSYPSDTVPP